MLTFEWNALRPGQRVVVHDDDDRDERLRDGTVRFVDTRGTAANEVAIEVDGSVRRVRRHAVHLPPVDPASCWRCECVREAAVRGAA